MGRKRLLVEGAYNVIAIFRKLGVSFEDIAALGFEFEGEPHRKVTPELLAVWYEEQKLDRKPMTDIIINEKKSKV